MDEMKKVAITGATGFIGSHIACDLLSRGYFLHVTLRNKTDERIAHLSEHPQGKNVRYFETDLLIPGSFDEALQGCDGAIHVASPATSKPRDPVRYVIEPAVSGTKNFLDGCVKNSLKKVIITSSFFTTWKYYKYNNSNDKYTEDDWNDFSTETFTSYAYSKLKAEQLAWEYERMNPNMKIVTILPGVVFGPMLRKHHFSESVELILDVINGMYGGVLDLSISVVDVRDVSLAHIRALELDDTHGRYLCIADHGNPLSLTEITTIVKAEGYHPPELNLTSRFFTILVVAASYLLSGQIGHYIRTSLGKKRFFSTEKIEKQLGIEFRTSEESLKDTLISFKTWGYL